MSFFLRSHVRKIFDTDCFCHFPQPIFCCSPLLFLSLTSWRFLQGKTQLDPINAICFLLLVYLAKPQSSSYERMRYADGSKIIRLVCSFSSRRYQVPDNYRRG